LARRRQTVSAVTGAGEERTDEEGKHTNKDERWREKTYL
jgi:hypothetical protein